MTPVRPRRAPTPSIDVSWVGQPGWCATFERVVRPSGVVVLAGDDAEASGAPGAPRMRALLHQHRLSTLMFDTPPAGPTAPADLSAELSRQVGHWLEVLAWLQADGEVESHHVGLLGTARGGAAALQAVAQQPGSAAAVVSRSGRPDLVAACLPRVQAATLLIVGAGDAGLLEGNRLAMRALTCQRRLEVVPGAGPMHAEPVALEAATHLAATWFLNHLAAP